MVTCVSLLLAISATGAMAAECALVSTGGFHAVTVFDVATREVTARIPVAVGS